jgi:RNA polymerase sigma factor (sigma-70 family)
LVTGESLLKAAEYARPMLRRMANGNEERVDEVLGYTICHLWEKRDGFRGDSSVNTWFFQAARRTYLWKFARSKWRFEPESHLEHFRERRLNPEQQLLAKERRQTLVKAVMSLPAVERSEALHLSNGVSPHENGRRKSRRYRARHRLREILSNHPIFQNRRAA